MRLLRRLLSGLAALTLLLGVQLPIATATPSLPEAPAPAERAPVTPVVSSIPADATVSAKSSTTSSTTSTGATVLAAVAPRDVATFNLVGASWTSASGDVALEVRTKAAAGWTDWTALDMADGAVGGVDKATKSTTDPMYVGAATGVELRASGAAGASITGLAATTVSSPEVTADSSLVKVSAQSVATSGIPAPAIISRAAWGADENLKAQSGADCMTAKVDDTVKAAVIHHTAGGNDYSAGQSASIVRGIYAYHVQGNGWCDIGYNFLVDKYGQLFEGRFGGVDLPIHGAHATLWNTDTMGVSFMMNTVSVQPSDLSLVSVFSLLAWKLGGYYRNAQGTTTLVGATQPVIFGHGDVMSTECPGTYLHARLQEIRDRVAGEMANRQYTPLNALWANAGGDASSFGSVHILERTVGAGRVVTFLHGGGYQRADGSVFWLGGDLDGLYTQRGGPTGALGWPTSSQVSANGILSATFEHGTLKFPQDGGSTTFSAASTYHAVTPARILDTRTTSAVAAYGTVSPQVAGVAGVPANASAVVLNLTMAYPTAPGYLTVWPTGSAAPVVSNLNFLPGKTVPNLVTVKVGTGGKVSIFNGASGPSHVVVDIAGYYVTGAPTAGGGMVAVTPTRILDTRSGVGAPSAVAPYADQLLTVTGGVVPAGATAVLLNITVDIAAAPGWVAGYPAGVSAPLVSNVNFIPGQISANLALIKIGTGGAVMLRNGSSVPISLIADVVGYVTGSGTTGGFLPADQPVRILDTRISVGMGGPVGAYAALNLPVAGRSGVPSTGVKAVVLNVTAIDPTSFGYVTAYPSGVTRPNASNLNVKPGQTVANQVVVGVGTDGKISLQNMTSGPIHFVADIAGYIV
ncbi:MAG: N-acetylmuramoyl-L-alanine amidase [Propionibacteriaceae bacterium]